MHPLEERACDELLEHPLLRTPPPEPERPRPPWVRKPRVFKVMARFPLLDKEFYARWVNHQKELQMMRHKVDANPPALFPELYLKPRRLDFYSRKLEENMNVNKDLIKKINLIQITGGMVDCWFKKTGTIEHDKLLRRYRQRQLDEIHYANIYLYTRMLKAKSEQPTTKELNELWKDTKQKLILGAALPFILFKTGTIDKGMKDPAFEKPFHIYRPRVYMTIGVEGGSKIGQVIIELFNDIVPQTCKLFMQLVRGDGNGYAYNGTRLFRIVPELYCRGGDVTLDNGFGCYLPENRGEPMSPENFNLKHSIPGTVSMVVTSSNEVCGQFNIIFKPLPQFDGKHVVFGRIIAGPFITLERISAIGLPLGTTAFNCQIRYCGWISKSGIMHEGIRNSIRFPSDKIQQRVSVK
ncbi:peptidyl-prolyl cis-trans isomerase E-like [Hyposmocoma kahamanoa]|uniref:peptidyl-prolyl cis-trans isomerase E-like n=1 Tax=Hyposmocoma kahamanoa TaxID=1477025 RepID=UPI000E6D61FF|nr:peptidyl-prolyl cis-trans isomerase E-like [Hyposmocoma kahamanoa]